MRHLKLLIQEVRAYWQSALDAFPKKVSDSVKGLLPSIDPGLVHGVHEPTSGKKPPVFDQMREWKREYPTSIILTQVRKVLNVTIYI